MTNPARQRGGVSIGSYDLASESEGILKQNRLDTVFFLFLLSFISLSPFIRFYSGALFLVFLSGSVFYLAIKRHFVPYPSLIFFTLIGILYVFLSYAEALPVAWTRFHNTSHIPQQASFVFALYPIILAAQLQWMFLFSHKRPAKYLLLLACAGILSGFLHIFFLDGSTYYFMFARNAVAFIYVAILWFLISSNAMLKPIWLTLLLVLLFLFGSSGQILVSGVVVATIVLSPWPRTTTNGAIFSMILLYGVGVIYIDEVIFTLWEFDHNTGIRLIFINDSLRALVQTIGIGVGFGTESIVNLYAGISHTHIEWDKEFSSFINTSIHNSFVAIAFRLGLPGCIAFLWFFFVDAMPAKTTNTDETRFTYGVFFLAFTALFVNVGLESPTYIVGIGFMLGLILAFKELARQRGEINLPNIDVSPNARRNGVV